MHGYCTIWLCILLPLHSLAQLSVDTSYNEESLVREVFFQANASLSHISFKGSYRALGLFEVNNEDFPLKKGIILSSGDAKSARGPNQNPATSSVHRTAGDSYLDKLSGGTTYDASVLEFSFVPEQNTIAFEYIFASEEYPEFVGKGFHDVFAFVLTDLGSHRSYNLALVPETQLPVHVDHINSKRHNEWYIANAYRKSGQWYDLLEYDGLTQVLTAQASVVPGRKYRIRLAIADVHDPMLDSSVLLKEKSFRSFNTPSTEIVTNSESTLVTPHTILFDWDSSELSSDAEEKLRQFADDVLLNAAKAIWVVGHTDSWGSDTYNEQLARRRVQTVVNYLARLGLKGKVRLYRRSKGENEPVANNANAFGRSQNRRVVVSAEF